MGQLAPTGQKERIAAIDMIRGLAILGIFIVNMGMINTPYMYLFLTNTELFTGWWDQLTEALITIFAQGKFYTMFSFLFGVSFVMLMERAEQRVKRPRILFVRRLAVLFLLGFIHAYFFWYGDILLTYAVYGLLLLAFYRVKEKTLLLWAGLILFFYLLLIILSAGLSALAATFDPAVLDAEVRQAAEGYALRIDASLLAYGEGAWSDIMNQRMIDLKEALSNNIVAGFLLFPLFLLGVYVGKRKIFFALDRHLPLIRKVWIWSLLVGLSLNGLKYWSMQQMDPLYPSIYSVWHAVGTAVGDPALCFFYISSLLLLLQNKTWVQRLSPLAYVGRTAVSNYLFQTVVCTFIFYSYGLGLYGKVGPLLGLVLTGVIFMIQLFISKAWLNSFAFGPVEWLWRSLTYGKLQPFRKS